MELSTSQLLAELQWVQRFTEKKNCMPVLAHVLFSADGDSLTITASDLEIAGSATVRGSGTDKWAIAAPATKLIKYLGKVSEERVTISANANKLSIIHGSSTVNTVGMDPESAPQIPASPTGCAMVVHDFTLAVKRVIFAISKEESRFTLNGALLEVTEQDTRLVATDGHRMSIAPVRTSGAEPTSALLPKRAICEAALLASKGEITIAISNENAFFHCEDRRITSRRLSGNFPDYRRVMPKHFKYNVVLPTKSSLAVLERVRMYDDEKKGVRFVFDGPRLTLKASSLGTGDATGAIAINPISAPPTQFEYAQNGEHVVDFLSNTTESSIVLAFNDHKSASVFATTDGWQYLLMPMRPQ